MRGHLPFSLTLMKTLRGLEVAGAIYLGDGLTPVVVGDTVRLYLDTDANGDFPEYIEGTVVAPITPVECGAKLSYNVEYDETDLEGSANLIRIQDAVDWRGVSQIEGFQSQLSGIFSVDDATSDGIENPDKVLKTDEDGGLLLGSLTVFGTVETGAIILKAQLSGFYSLIFAPNDLSFNTGLQTPKRDGTICLTSRDDGRSDTFIAPVADPHIAGAVWNNAGTLTISVG